MPSRIATARLRSFSTAAVRYIRRSSRSSKPSRSIARAAAVTRPRPSNAPAIQYPISPALSSLRVRPMLPASTPST